MSRFLPIGCHARYLRHPGVWSSGTRERAGKHGIGVALRLSSILDSDIRWLPPFSTPQGTLHRRKVVHTQRSVPIVAFPQPEQMIEAGPGHPSDDLRIGKHIAERQLVGCREDASSSEIEQIERGVVTARKMPAPL